jgi:hypothetical protein
MVNQGGKTQPYQQPQRDLPLPIELIYPELRDALPLEHAEGVATKSISLKGEAYMPTAIDDEEDIWEVEALLAK